MEWSKLQKANVHVLLKYFIKLTLVPGIQSYNTFRSKFPHSFCKLDRFVTINYFSGALKQSNLQKD
jgi:hypothetical protein